MAQTTVTKTGDKDEDPKSTIIPAVLDHHVIQPLRRVLNSPTTRKTLTTGILFTVLVALSIAASAVAYLFLYYFYIPQIGVSKEVWLQYGHGEPPYAQIDLGKVSFATDQAYDVMLEMVVPASPNNIDLGNFMVDLDLQTSNRESVFKAARPANQASLIWTPGLVRFAQTLFRLPLYLLFSHTSAASQKIRVPLVTRQILRTFSTKAISHAIVSVGREDGHDLERACNQGPSRELQIYSAKLSFIAHLQGFRWLMYHHRIISFLLFSSIFFFVTISSALLLWGILSFRSSSSASKDSISASPSNVSVSSEKSVAMTLEEHDAQEREEATKRAQEARMQEGKRMIDPAEEESVLRHIKLEKEDEPMQESSPSYSEEEEEEEAVLVKKEEMEPAITAKKEENGDDDDTATVGGSVTSAGDTASRRSFGTSITSASTATDSRSAGTPSIRQRPSSRSLKSRDE